MNASVHVVAVARKRDHYMTLFNLKSKYRLLMDIRNSLNKFLKGIWKLSCIVNVVQFKKYMLIFLFWILSEKRACLPGIGRGDGWIIPMNIFIETEQFIPQHCTLFENLGKSSKSCYVWIQTDICIYLLKTVFTNKFIISKHFVVKRIILKLSFIVSVIIHWVHVSLIHCVLACTVVIFCNNLFDAWIL